MGEDLQKQVVTAFCSKNVLRFASAIVSEIKKTLLPFSKPIFWFSPINDEKSQIALGAIKA